jgi:hypothetical protein
MTCIEQFGPDRCMFEQLAEGVVFASCPVQRLQTVSTGTGAERAALFHDTAVRPRISEGNGATTATTTAGLRHSNDNASDGRRVAAVLGWPAYEP